MAELNDAERKWLKKLQKVLNECPSKRLSAYTIGDDTIDIYDNSFESEILGKIGVVYKDWYDVVADFDAHLISIKMPFPVHSTAG